jgi:hypothetical protein
VIIARLMPVCLAFFWLRPGSLDVIIDMKTILSIHRTISRSVSVINDIQTSAFNNESIVFQK